MAQHNSDSDDQTTEDVSQELPEGAPRQIDATAMKAFAHPLRMAMYDYLNDRGSATATMLAKHTGESTGQTSYHLRQLERHGFVTDDPTRGTGRERWWKSVGFSMQGLEMAKEDSSTRPALASMMRNQIAHQAAALGDWFDRADTEDPDWANISANHRYSMLLTRDELIDLRKKVLAGLQEYAEISEKRAESGPEAEEGKRRIRIYLDVFPLPEDE